MNVSDLKNILIIIVARIGDTLLVTPAIHALKKKFPAANIDVMAHRKRISVLENNHEIHVLFSNDFWDRCRMRFRRSRPYDMVFVYGDDKNLLRYGKKIGRHIVGFKHNDSSVDVLIDSAVPPPSEPMHAVDERLLLVNAVGVTGQEKKLVYSVSNAEKTWADSYLRQSGIGERDLTVGFQVAGYPTKAYRDWPQEHFISLGNYILSKYNAKILLFGSRHEIRKAGHIQKALGSNAVLVAGKTSVRQAAALIAKLNAFVTTDTGPMHISFALEVPTVALFHCMHPSRYLGPSYCTETHKLIQLEPPPGERCGRHLTLHSIGSDQVWNDLQEILQSSIVL